MDSVEIQQRVQCCVCNGPLAGGRLNMVSLGLKATWPYPVARNLLTDWGPAAIAILCDGCAQREGVHIARVVEFRGERVLYHAVEQLEELPPEPTYQMVRHRDGLPGIHCLRCGQIGWDPNDVLNLYCGYCHQYHEVNAS
jgi:hypothetical protein